MEKLIGTLKERKKASQSLNRNSKLFKNIIKSISERKAENIVSLDLRKIEEAVADFFVLCEAQSSVQVKAIAQNIIDNVRDQVGEKPYHVEYGDHWTLVDYVNVVVHIFQKDMRQFYSLESLWADAERMEHEDK